MIREHQVVRALSLADTGDISSSDNHSFGIPFRPHLPQEALLSLSSDSYYLQCSPLLECSHIALKQSVHSCPRRDCLANPFISRTQGVILLQPEHGSNSVCCPLVSRHTVSTCPWCQVLIGIIFDGCLIFYSSVALSMFTILPHCESSFLPLKIMLK